MPITARLRALALGSDSDGPALAVWFGDPSRSGSSHERGAASSTSSRSPYSARRCRDDSPGPSQRLDPPAALHSARLEKRPHVRASSGGGMFGHLANTGAHESHTVIAHGSSIHKPAFGRRGTVTWYLAPTATRCYT